MAAILSGRTDIAIFIKTEASPERGCGCVPGMLFLLICITGG